MSSRYYDSCNSEHGIKPGRISNELREALNIPENDIPIWIYRMRALGYPPGWLKKAIVDTSDIFDTDTTESNSESKKRKNPSSDEVQYDHSKLIEYPGFNSPMPEGCVDYHYYINMPAMLAHQQLDYAKKHMNAFKPIHIPRRIKTTTSADDSGLSLDNSNIDLSRSDELKDPKSPDNDNPRSTDSDEISEKEQKKTRVTDEGFVKSSGSNTSLAAGVKLLSKGSPLPKPVERAPLEKFSEGVVGELLYFENIPNSTGKFDNIRGLLNSIRKSKSETDTSFSSLK